MKTKKNVFIKRRGKHPIYKWISVEKLARKISNIFWNWVDLSSCKMDKLAELYEILISKEYKKESKLFDISKDDNILHIGCGAYPITAITLAKNNGVKITGIDNNLRAIKLANNLINKKELGEKIKIEQGNGTDYPVEEFDTIIVSGCASPKIEILEHVFGRAKSRTKIIVREMNLAAKPLANFIDSHDDINIINKMKSRPFPLIEPLGWHSFYLKK